MFKIHQLFVSESSYKTGNVRCLLNGNLEFLGFVSVSVLRDRVCVLWLCLYFIWISVSVWVSYVLLHIRAVWSVSCLCPCPCLCLCHICVMSVSRVCVLTTYTYPCCVRVHVICTCYISVSCLFLCFMFVSIFVSMFVSVHVFVLFQCVRVHFMCLVSKFVFVSIFVSVLNIHVRVPVYFRVSSTIV